MSLKTVFYGRNLTKIPLTSYPVHTISSRGVGGVIRPRHFFIPNKVKAAKINTVLNVPDLTPDKTSEFASSQDNEELSKLPISTTKTVLPTFKPIPVNEAEFEILDKKGKKRKEQFTKTEETNSKTKKLVQTVEPTKPKKSRHSNHRVKIV